MGPVLDSGVPLPSRVPMGSSRCARWGPCCLPPSSLQLGAVVERSCPTCYKCLFLPLLGSLSFSSSHFSQPRFYFSSAHCSLLTLLFFVNSLQSSFLLSISLWFSIPLCSDRPYGESSGGFLSSGMREGLETGQKRYRRRSSPQNARTWNQETIQWRHPSLARVCLVSLRPSRVPLLLFLMYNPPSDIVTTDNPPRQLLCRI
jgi:hypothetical protein